MESAKLRRLDALAEEHRRQLLKVDRGLQRARLVVLEPKSKPHRKASKSPISAKKTSKIKKAKASKTMVSFGKQDVINRSPGMIKGRKKSDVGRSKTKIDDNDDEKEKWRAEFLPLIQQHLIETYAPYESTIANLKKQISLVESETQAHLLGVQLIKTSVDSIGQTSEGALYGSERRAYTFGAPNSFQKNDDSTQSESLNLEIALLERKNQSIQAKLNQILSQQHDYNELIQEEERNINDFDYKQGNIEELRTELAILSSKVSEPIEETRLRAELKVEQELVKNLAVQLQLGESERTRLYSTLDELRIASALNTQSPQRRNEDSQTGRGQILQHKIEVLKKMNTDLAMRGRDLEERIVMLESIERNLQEYHDEFCNQVNQSQHGSQNLYKEYLYFLVDSYKHFLQQLLLEESKELSSTLGQFNPNNDDQGEYEEIKPPSNPYIRLLNRPQ
jgi:hypothetical protein